MNHGTRSAYVKGCRCEDCTTANRRYAKTHGMYGTDLIDAGPVRAHLAQLRAAGVGRRTIAAESGVALTVVSRLLGIDTSKPATRVRIDTAARLLAVKPSAARVVEPLGARRRLQALTALGWSQHALARMLDTTPGHINVMLHGTGGAMYASTAARIAALYDELCGTPGPSKRSATTARLNGWLPPAAWDDIDTDDAAEAAAHVRYGRESLTREERGFIVAAIGRGLSAAEVGREYGLTKRSVQRIVQEAS